MKRGSGLPSEPLSGSLRQAKPVRQAKQGLAKALPTARCWFKGGKVGRKLWVSRLRVGDLANTSRKKYSELSAIGFLGSP